MRIWYILFFTLLVSCRPFWDNKVTPIQLMNELFPKMMTISSYQTNLVNKGNIESPKGIPSVIFEATFLEINKNLEKKLCLYYTVPFREKKGELWFVEREKSDSCVDVIESDLVLRDIDQFELLMNEKKQADVMVMKFSHLKKNYQYEFTFAHYKPMKNFSYAAPVQPSGSLPFLHIASLEENTNQKLGSINDNFASGTAKKCHTVNENCETVGENLCHLCRYGWYEVVDYACPQGGSKFCGQSRCGEKGQPACPAGYLVHEIAPSEVCVDDSEAGFCQGELRPICNDQNVLVCR